MALWSLLDGLWGISKGSGWLPVYYHLSSTKAGSELQSTSATIGALHGFPDSAREAADWLLTLGLQVHITYLDLPMWFLFGLCIDYPNPKAMTDPKRSYIGRSRHLLWGLRYVIPSLGYLEPQGYILLFWRLPICGVGVYWYEPSLGTQ